MYRLTKYKIIIHTCVNVHITQSTKIIIHTCVNVHITHVHYKPLSRDVEQL